MDEANRTNLNILLVDNDIDAANGLSRLLRACGHTVRVSYNTRDGLEVALRIKPDLILHDITMPEIDCYEAAGGLREMPLLSRTVSVACSGSVDEAKARNAGFGGWLVKPISDDDLETALAGCCNVSTRVPRTAQAIPSETPPSKRWQFRGCGIAGQALATGTVK
jgi:CheY-like chemotaxis protein